jgi:hypothetical protein
LAAIDKRPKAAMSKTAFSAIGRWSEFSLCMAAKELSGRF